MSEYVEVKVKVKLSPIDEDEVSTEMIKSGKSIKALAAEVAPELIFDAIYDLYKTGNGDTEFTIEDFIVEGPKGRRIAP